MRTGPARLGGVLIAVSCAFAFAAPAATAQKPLLVFAAASLKNAFDDVLGAWKQAGGGAVRVAYASSSALARQIDRGAPATVYISAHRQWVEWLGTRGKLAGGTRISLLGNRLVMIAAARNARPIQLSVQPVLARLGDRRLAVGDPRHVPAGLYAKAALTSLGLWKAVEGRLAPAANVRAALALVARGEAPLGIVYRSDTTAERRVATVAVFPESSHPPIRYEAVIVRGHDGPRAKRLLVFLMGKTAAARFRRHGFCAPPPCSD